MRRLGSSMILMGLALAVLTLNVNGEEPLSGPVEPTGETPRETGWRTETVTSGLAHPWGLAWLPDGKTILVTEREGRLRVVENGQLRMEPVAGLPRILAVGQGGLMEVSLHPDFEQNRMLYLSYTSGSPSANRTSLARATIDPGLTRLSNVETIFEVSQTKGGGQHFGSRILWLADGTFLMSIGDGGNPPVKLEGEFIRQQAQDLSSHLGKVLRMNDAGEPVDSNPFAEDGDPDTKARIWTYGHRNIQGLAMHPERKTIWATEHGARGGDELNELEPGKNYGWPKATYSREYFGPRISAHTSLPNMVDPVVVWTPCIAPSGLTFYLGDAFPKWRGDLFAGGLVLEEIRRLDFEDGKLVGETTLHFEDRIRDVQPGPDGELYVLTDEQDGRLLRIVPE